MGTNYYAVKKKPRIIKVYDKIHLGKSSIGWRFAFQGQPEYYKNYKEFENFILNNKEFDIIDEYGHKIEPKELLELIAEKQKENNPDDFTYDENIDGYRFSDEEFS